MKKLVALVVGIAFSFAIGLAIPQTFAQTPAPKDEKKGEMMEKKGDMDKKGEKKAAAKKKKTDKKMDKDKMDKMDKKEEKK
ncbi:MAG: hypothetical protein ACHQ8D_11350 [Candidatus Rokuibacteriota bacterium]|jgi:uncharacterized protein involved in copper resistance